MTTIAESFRQRLPTLDQRVLPNPMASATPDDRPYRQSHASAPSTTATDPPGAWEQDQPSTLFDLVRDLIPQGNEQIPPPLQGYLPALESSHMLHTEGDVVRAAVLYLLNPVNKALELLCPAGCHIECVTDASHGMSSRTDIAWRCGDVQNRSTTFAVLEFKNTYALHWPDFKPGLANLNPNAPIDEQPEEMLTAASDSRTGTLLNGNAVVVAKQAQKYHNETGCTDVAIFDWDTMFIFDFFLMDEDSSPPQLVKGIWFEETVHGRPHETFRMLLFGMLVRSMRRFQWI
ncbi:MAG: hypothetical protein M1817_001388 [Caeruleum heppii]|nr:MAG: hypothetical protein M1817_001388 [Caeruleum heppii]